MMQDVERQIDRFLNKLQKVPAVQAVFLMKDTQEALFWMRLIQKLLGKGIVVQDPDVQQIKKGFSWDLFDSSLFLAVFTKIHKEQLQALEPWKKEGSYVLAATTPSVFSSLRQEDILCLETKPFEEKKRMQEYSAYFCSKQKCSLEESALEKLLSMCEEVPYFCQQLETLSLYQPSLITKKDVKDLVTPQEKSLWQMSQGLVWEKKPPQKFSLVDERFFYPFLASLRKEVRIGLFLQNHQEPSFAKLWPQLIQKRKQQMKDFPQGFFAQALLALFTIEKKAKSGISLPICFTQLCAIFHG